MTSTPKAAAYTLVSSAPFGTTEVEGAHGRIGLDPLTYAVLRLSDGRRSVAAIARQLAQDAGTASLEAVHQALDRLADAGLIEARLAPPVGLPAMSRRGVVAGLGVYATAALPAAAQTTDARAAEETAKAKAAKSKAAQEEMMKSERSKAAQEQEMKLKAKTERDEAERAKAAQEQEMKLKAKTERSDTERAKAAQEQELKLKAKTERSEAELAKAAQEQEMKLKAKTHVSEHAAAEQQQKARAGEARSKSPKTDAVAPKPEMMSEQRRKAAAESAAKSPQ